MSSKHLCEGGVIRRGLKDKPGKPGACGILDPAKNHRGAGSKAGGQFAQFEFLDLAG